MPNFTTTNTVTLTRGGDGTYISTAAADKLGFYGATPVVQQASTAAGTDATTTQALANALRTALLNLGLIA